MGSKDDPPADPIGGPASSAPPPRTRTRLPASTNPPPRHMILRPRASSTSRRPPGLSVLTRNPSKADPLKAAEIGGSAAKADVVAAAVDDAVVGADAVAAAPVKEDAVAATANLVGAVDLVVGADPISKDMPSPSHMLRGSIPILVYSRNPARKKAGKSDDQADKVAEADPLKAAEIGGSAAKADVVAAAVDDAVVGADAVAPAPVKEDAVAATTNLVGAVDLVVGADPISKDMTRKGICKSGDQALKDANDKKKGELFLEQFYKTLVETPGDVHKLYNNRCKVSWIILEKSLHMQTAEEIQKLTAPSSSQLGYFSLKYSDVHVVKNILHVSARGTYKFDESYNFTQSLMVHIKHMKILSDFLVVVPNVFRFRVKTSAMKVTAKKDDTILEKQEDVAEGSCEVLLVYNEECLEHEPPSPLDNKDPHPENPDRINNIMETLRKDGTLQRVTVQSSEPAEPGDVLLVHNQDLVSCVDCLPMTAEQFQICPYISKLGSDMYSSAGTRKAVYYAAGAVLHACDAVVKDKYNKAFALVRPPGHHSSSAFAEGFCYFNNAAIAVKRLQALGVRDIALVDTDTHHGNGSQSIFFNDNTVLVFSTHCIRLDYPPSTYVNIKRLSPRLTSIGEGIGIGYNVNVPMKKGYTDADILYAIDEVLVPLLRSFKPGGIVVSAGFDGAMGEGLGGNLSRKCFGTIADKLVQEGDGKLILCLEGGYQSEVLPFCVSNVLRSLLGDKEACLTEEEIGSLPRPSRYTQGTVKKLKEQLRSHWNIEGW